MSDESIGWNLITLEKMKTVAGREEIWKHLVELGLVPNDFSGRSAVHAACLYCLRTGHRPAALMNTIITQNRLLRNAWATSADRIDAAKQIRESIRASKPSPELVRLSSPDARGDKKAPTDWTSIDERIDSLTDDEALNLLPSQFGREYFQRAEPNGKRRRDLPVIRDWLRRAIATAANVSPRRPHPPLDRVGTS